MLYATLDGTARCRSCGQTARLNLASRWMMSCVLALILPNILLYGGVFYSGHLFVISTFIIIGAWGMLSWVCSPILTLEVVAVSPSLTRKKSIFALGMLLVAAILIDSVMRARFE